jgi:hypothetical protein
VKSRSHGRKRAYFYGCTSYHLRGTSVCKNAIEVPMATADRAVLDAFDKVLTPTVLDKVLDAALKQLTAAPKDAAKRRKELEQQLAAVTVESGRLTEALASGGDISVIVVALKDRQARQEALQEEIARLSDVAIAVDPERLRRLLHERLTDWRGVLTRQIPQARQILKKLMDGPVIFQPVKEGYAKAGGSAEPASSLPYCTELKLQRFWRPRRDSQICGSGNWPESCEDQRGGHVSNG